MPRQFDPQTRGIALADWPPRDAGAWNTAMAAASAAFSRRGYASTLNHRTVKKYCDGYGRWLGYLLRAGRLDPAEAAGARATPANLDGYFEHLLACSNRPYSIVGRFVELASALRIIDPAGDHSHVTAPDGVPWRARLDMRKRPSPSTAQGYCSSGASGWRRTLSRWPGIAVGR